MSGHCNECGNTQCVCAANDPAWRTFKKRGDVARLEARVAELEAERDEWKASATTLKNLAGLATSTLEAERDARIPVSWIRECAKKWSQKKGGEE